MLCTLHELQYDLGRAENHLQVSVMDIIIWGKHGDARALGSIADLHVYKSTFVESAPI